MLNDVNQKERPMTRDIKAAVRAYILQNFIVEAGTKIADGDSLLQMQILDSTGFLELVSFIETNFGVRVEDDEMTPENLESLDNIEAFVVRKSEY